jgi:hypothetical protein
MDSGNNRVLRYNPGSNYGVTVATTSFNTPRGMRLDSIGNLYVTDLSQRVIKFPCGRCNTDYFDKYNTITSYSKVYNASTTTYTTTIPTTVTTTTSTTTTSVTTTTASKDNFNILFYHLCIIKR